jgi:predicted Zn-dependent protease
MNQSAVFSTSRWVPFIAMVLLAACSSVKTTAPGAVGVTRSQHMSSMVSAQAIEQTAAKAYDTEVARARAAGALNVDAAETVRVRKIAARLIEQTPTFRPDAKNWKWNINVQSDRQLNAYCMPGGRIMVYSGLINTLSLTDDELATVMAHEIAHALREHSREQVSRAYMQQAGLGALAALAGLNDASMQLASVFSDVTFSLPKSRDQESEADKIGLELMARAGYDPKAALSLWQKMAKAGQTSTPGFLSTHPSGSTRAADISALLPKVEPLYEQARKK